MECYFMLLRYVSSAMIPWVTVKTKQQRKPEPRSSVEKLQEKPATKPASRSCRRNQQTIPAPEPVRRIPRRNHSGPPKPFWFLPNRITASNSGARRNNLVRRNQTGASSGPPEFPATEPVRRTYRRNASDLAATNLGFDAPSSYQTTLLFLFYPCIRWRTIYSLSPPLSFLRLEVIS